MSNGAKNYRISSELVDGRHRVVTLHHVPSYDALCEYEYTDEDITIVIPSPTCTKEDLKAMEEHCDEFDFNFEPHPPTGGEADTGTQGGGSSNGNDQAVEKDPLVGGGAGQEKQA